MVENRLYKMRTESISENPESAALVHTGPREKAQAWALSRFEVRKHRIRDRVRSQLSFEGLEAGKRARIQTGIGSGGPSRSLE